MTTQKPTFIFFGTDTFSTTVLDELEAAGFLPKAVICAEDKPVGRKMVITPPPAKVWAEARGIKVFQPKTLREEKDPAITEQIRTVLPAKPDLFVVASYGKIIPQTILDIPKYGTLNVHPSLLPKLRGPSPIESAILTENETGVTIMLLDALMDHGPIIAQEKIMSWDENNPPYAHELEKTLGSHGGKLLAENVLGWVSGKIQLIEQDHSRATVCKKIVKEDGLLDLTDSPLKNLRKIRAYSSWPKAYMLIKTHDAHMRVIVTQASIENHELSIDRVIPEGKKEMSYEDFKRGKHTK